MVGSILVYNATGSATYVALVTTMQFGPPLLLAPMSGRLADRAGPKRQIIAGHLLGTIAAASLAGYLFSEAGRQNPDVVLPVMLASLGTGVAFAVTGPALQSIVMDLVQPGEAATAVGLNGLPMVIARAVGPAAGAAILSAWGPGLALAVAALAQLQLAVTVSLLRTRRTGDASSGETSIRAALRHVRQDRTIMLLLLCVSAASFGSEPLVTLAVPLAHESGLGVQFAGAVTGSFGVGAIAGSVLYFLSHRRTGLARLCCIGLLNMTAGLVALGFSGDPRVTLGAALLCGVGMTITVTSVTAMLQFAAPPYMRGRIMALWVVGFAGTRPIAAFFAGAVADLTSPAVTLTACAAGVLVVAAVCRPSRLSISEDLTNRPARCTSGPHTA